MKSSLIKQIKTAAFDHFYKKHPFLKNHSRKTIMYMWGSEINDYVEGAKTAINLLQPQIEEMKCGGNCQHLYHINTGGCYDAKCKLTGCDCINCKDNWELRK